MGDIKKTIEIFTLGTDGEPGKRLTYKAIVDTGATMTVVPSRVATETGAKLLPDFTRYEGKVMPLALFYMRLRGRRCEDRPVVAIVSDSLARKAGKGADIILGHDYLQRSHAVLRFNVDPHEVKCTTRRKLKRRPRA